MDIAYQPPLVVPQPADFRAVEGLVTALCGRYRGLRSVTVGSSVLERPLRALVLTAGHGGRRQRVLIAAAFHGQEWLTALCALRLCEELCRAARARLPLCDVEVEKILEEREIWFLPLVNPDGADIAIHGSAAAGKYAAFVAAHGGDTPGVWQANARGVDINHNFNAGWEEMQALAAKNHRDAPGPRQYCGPSPESEPETRAVTDLCRRYGFRHLVALHSQGEEIYWRYGDHTPPQSRLMAQVLGAAGGYAVADPTGMAAYGGCKDWFIRCFHRPGFTIELGRGENPLPLSDFEPLYEKVREMLVLCAVL